MACRGMYNCLSAVNGLEKANRRFFFQVDFEERVERWVPRDVTDLVSDNDRADGEGDGLSTNRESADNVVRGLWVYCTAGQDEGSR